jgi:hypothetical protein
MKHSQLELEKKNTLEINLIVGMLLFPDKNIHANPHCDLDTRAYIAGTLLTMDYCNNPSDIMPIAIKRNISLIAPNQHSFPDKRVCHYAEHWVNVEHDGNVELIGNLNQNPYRAICIVFILMQQDKENK